MIIRSITVGDLSQTAKIHKETFIRQTLSYEWLECTLKAFPRMLSYVAIINGMVAGYIIWSQKSGFRPEAIMELEQLAVQPTLQSQGIGKALIKQSLHLVRMQLTSQGSNLKHVVVTTRADNYAQALYKKVLGAQVEATVADLYSADEVFMVARNI